MLQGLGGHHREQRAVMEIAQIGQDRPAQPAHAVVLAVSLEVGAEVRGHRQLQLQCGLQGRPAQRDLGGDMYQIGPLQAPALQQGAERRQPQLQLRIARDRQARHQHFIKAHAVLCGAGDLGAMLSRAYQLQIVAAVAQPLDQPRDSHRHAIDLGRVGLGHHGQAQRWPCRRQIVDGQVRVHGQGQGQRCRGHGRRCWQRAATV